MASSIIPDITKRIAFNAATQGYDLYIAVGGDPEQHIGAAATYALAEQRCQAYARDLLASDLLHSAADLGGRADTPVPPTNPTIAHLPDGTPVRGARDSDGTPLAVYAEARAWYASARALSCINNWTIRSHLAYDRCATSSYASRLQWSNFSRVEYLKGSRTCPIRARDPIESIRGSCCGA